MDSISRRPQSIKKSNLHLIKQPSSCWMRAFNYSCFLIFIGVFLAGCTALGGSKESSDAASAPETTISEVVSVTEPPLPEVTDTPSVTPLMHEATVTPYPTQTDIPPTATSKPSNTPIPATLTSTVTPVPTMLPEQEEAFLNMLMTSNGGCDLPCWWGVTPGQTEPQIARDMFASQGIDDWSVSFDGTYTRMGLGYPRPGIISNNPNDVIVEYRINKNVIQYILVEAGYRQDEIRPRFMQDWQLYTLSEMLNRYGIPSYVELVKIGNSPYYRLVLSYIPLGVEITYVITPKRADNGQIQVCSDFEEVDYIFLTLYPTEQVEEIPGIIPNRLDDYSSWESITGSDLEAFYETFAHPDGPACVEVTP